ncbi:MAG: hypothetical protein IJ769_05885 [Clostridia bacterium]|nr:hypothetical protein [Clostridia bacterium]
MARLTVEGIEGIEAQLGQLGRPMIRRIVEAGARRDAVEQRGNISAAGHRRTGSMHFNVRAAEYHEIIGGGVINVYPQDSDKKGVPNALKAFVINYGRGKRRTKRMGDKFITGKLKQTEKAVHDAMQAESDRIISEINKGR